MMIIIIECVLAKEKSKTLKGDEITILLNLAVRWCTWTARVHYACRIDTYRKFMPVAMSV